MISNKNSIIIKDYIKLNIKIFNKFKNRFPKNKKRKIFKSK